MANYGKKGQFMGLYLVVLVIALWILIGTTYYFHQKSLENSLVSPQVLLEIEDQENYFEIQEQEFILDSAREVGWGVGNFAEGTKIKFCKKFPSMSSSSFIFSDIVYEGRSDWEDAFDSSVAQETFCKKVYDFEFDGNRLSVKRAEIGKHLNLFAFERSKTSFVVDVDYTFEKEYLIKEGDLK